MGKTYNSGEIIKILIRLGFKYAPKRGKGSHTALFKESSSGKKLLVIIPKRKALAEGTLRAILKQAEITFKDLEKR